MSSFDPDADIPDLSGKVCLVTGANSGLGEATARAIAQHSPAQLYVASRSFAKGEVAIERIRASSPAAAKANLILLELDLASFSSVRAAAERVLRESSRLDQLQLNGGVAAIAHDTTKEGYEIHFGTNYLGHALLTQLLMPLMLSTAAMPGADVRIVSMSSAAHRASAFHPAEGIAFAGLKSDMKPPASKEEAAAAAAVPATALDAGRLYGQANFCKVVFAAELARRYPSIISTSVCPGIVKTTIWNGEKSMGWLFRTFIVTPVVWWVGTSIEDGAKCQLWNGYARREDVVNGACYDPIGKIGADHELTRNQAIRDRLWEWTSTELEQNCGTTWPEA
jgi:NAD(P)-dependent dehydrogenase (short-subunit alcohol dehydrogenase family)